MIAVLVAFGVLVHGVLAYYFVPVYAFLFCAVKDRKSFAAVSVGSLASVFVPEGVFQVLLPIAISFGLVIMYDYYRMGRSY